MTHLNKGLLGLACLSLSVFAHANLVSNGGFETGDLTDWTLVGDANNTFVSGGFVSEGDNALWMGEVGGIGTLSQTLTTVVGQEYTFSFDFAGDGDSPSFFSASLGGNTYLSLTDPDFDPDYVPYSYTFTATSTSSLLEFAFRDDPFFLNLDNVSVTANSVPEPVSMSVLGLGALALAAKRRRK